MLATFHGMLPHEGSLNHICSAEPYESDSPFGGKVIELTSQTDQYHIENSAPLVRLGSLSGLYFSADRSIRIMFQQVRRSLSNQKTRQHCRHP